MSGDMPVAAGEEKVEFRVELPKELVSILDAVAIHEKSSRTAIVAELVRRMAEDKLAQAKVLHRVTRGTALWGDE